jgi:hypothetical protein
VFVHQVRRRPIRYDEARRDKIKSYRRNAMEKNGKTKGRRGPKIPWVQLTTLLEPAVAEALAKAAAIDRSKPGIFSRKLITNALVQQGLMQHPALTAYPDLAQSK